jgi:cyclophilin family peptidyl-prolyl cis-trans isomerase
LVALIGMLSVQLGASRAEARIVRFQTSSGNVDVRLYETATPNSVANFMNYVNANRYVGTFIHRVPQQPTGGTSNFVVQGGGFLLNNSIFAAAGIVTNPPIGDEPGISNIRGTLSFAKNAQGATSQWFFNIGDNSFLNAQNFTAFGRVLGNGMSVVDAINNLQTVNASVAENAPGEDFDEIPVRNLQQVLNQNDITSNEAVMVTGVSVLNLPAGDYDGNGIVNNADYSVWRAQYGSTTLAEADGNGNGRVDMADYVLWRKTKTAGSGSGSLVESNVPEPSSALLILFGGLTWAIFTGRLVSRRTRQSR